MVMDDPDSSVADSAHVALERSAVSYGDSKHYTDTEDMSWAARISGLLEGDGNSLEDTTMAATPEEPTPPLDDADTLRDHVDNL
ncbi:unnamed protein product, partial [Laminaria digitata]